jgi:predicted Rossmann fold nucleotide-binding protein DprA/Smf involved in DNA uptake
LFLLALAKTDALRITKIISGGQAGADRAALDMAIELGIPHKGWVSKGRKTGPR